jgi:short chain dehydrogenase
MNVMVRLSSPHDAVLLAGSLAALRMSRSQLASNEPSTLAGTSPPPMPPTPNGARDAPYADEASEVEVRQMARIFITGSAGGLGRAAAQTLLSGGHEVIVHARTAERLAAADDLIDRGASAVVGDLADLNQTRAVADQVNQLARSTR